MPGPKWDTTNVPCPICGQNALVYDGSVKWRSGTRPPRSLARKDSLGSSPRADFEIAHYLHCATCASLLSDEVDGRAPHLNVEQAGAVDKSDPVEQVENVEQVAKQERPENVDDVESAEKAGLKNQHRSATGWIPGSVGDVSARIGYDVRDLIMDGYSRDEIDDVLYGRRTLEELLKSGPGSRR